MNTAVKKRHLSNKMKLLKLAIAFLGIVLPFNLTPKCLAESATERDIANVLPGASLFVKKTDPFRHYLGYTGEGGYLVGTAFVTTEVVPSESWGYRGQIVTLVGVGPNGKITGVKVLSELESPRYTKGLLGDEAWFLSQFKGKDAGDSFLFAKDIDGITGATVTSSAVTRSIHSGLELVTEELLGLQVDKDSPVKHLFFQHLFWQMDFMLLWGILAVALFSFFNKNEFLRYFVLGLSFGYLGIYMGGGLSINDVLTLLSLHTPVFSNNLYWYSLVFIAIGLSVLAGRFFCGWLCPFGAFLEVLYRLVPIDLRVAGSIDRYLKLVKYVILAIILILALVFGNNILASYVVGVVEPFATFFHLDGDVISWTWLILVLVGSAAISRFYCKYFCPLGALLALLSGLCSFLGLRKLRVKLPADNCKGCKLGLRQCQMNAMSYDKKLKRAYIDGDECFMCNSCAAVCPVQSKTAGRG